MSSASAVKVGLVIVTHNSTTEISRCLQCIRTQTRLPDRIVVADSGSTDNTVATVEAVSSRLGLHVELLRFDANVGFAIANNRSVAKLADCELLALLNPDAFPEPDWLKALLDAAAAHDAAAFASRLMVADADDVLDGSGDVFHVSGLAWRRGHGQHLALVGDALQIQPVFAACAAAALYRREDWNRVGGFDERFFCYAEDVDLGFRLQLLGRGCRYVPHAVARHVGSAITGVDSAFSVYHGYRNLEWTFIKNMPLALLVRYFPLHLLVVLVQFVWFLRKKRGGSLLAAKWDALKELRGVLRDRRRVQGARVISARDLQRVLDRTPLWSRFVAVRSRTPSRRRAFSGDAHTS